MATAEIQQLKSIDKTKDIYPITLERAVLDSNGDSLDENLSDLGGRVDSVLSDIADVEPTATASKAHAVGGYLVLNDVLYKVTAAITVGDTISTSSNIEIAKIMEAIAAAGASDMTGATETQAGTHGLVPAPAAGKQGSYFRGDGTWNKVAASEATATDAEGLKGTAGATVILQGLVDEIANRVSPFSIVNGKLCVTYTKED